MMSTKMVVEERVWYHK